MNVIFVINNTLITSIFIRLDPGRDHKRFIYQFGKEAGILVEERPVSVDELKEAFHNKTITEAFGVGTAAVASPIKIIGIDNINYNLPSNNSNPVSDLLKAKLNDIRTGKKT